VGVLNNFKKSKIIWVEKYIHILVHIYPISSGFYILSQEGFNDSGFGVCNMNGYPLECWLDPNIPCTRGPEPRQTVLFRIIPELLILLFPSIVMVILFVRVKKCQKDFSIDALSIAKQGVIYVVALYWTLVPFLIGSLLGRLEFEGSIDIYHRIFPYYISALLNFSIFALWAMLPYLYFSVEKKNDLTTVTRNKNKSKNNATEILKKNGMTTDIVELKPNHISDCIFNSQRIVTQDTHTSRLSTETITATDTVAQQRKYSFNIFDGTNASGAFADFIHDGDSDDEKEDNYATDRWAAIQDHT